MQYSRGTIQDADLEKKWQEAEDEKTKTEKKRKRLTKQVVDLALLSQGMLKGEKLTNFINRSIELIK